MIKDVEAIIVQTAAGAKRIVGCGR